MGCRPRLVIVLLVALAGLGTACREPGLAQPGDLAGNEEAACRVQPRLLKNRDCRRFWFDHPRAADVLSVHLTNRRTLGFLGVLNPVGLFGEYAPASLVYRGISYSPIGFKREQKPRLEFVADVVARKRSEISLKLNQYGKQGVYGLEHLVLTHAEQGAEFLRQGLARKVFEDLQLMIPRTAYLMLKLDGVDQGLFKLTEPADREMAAAYFGDHEGVMSSPFFTLLSRRDSWTSRIPEKYLFNFILATVITGDQSGFFEARTTQVVSRNGQFWPIPTEILLPFRQQCNWKSSLEKGEYSNDDSFSSIPKILVIAKMNGGDFRRRLTLHAQELLGRAHGLPEEATRALGEVLENAKAIRALPDGEEAGRAATEASREAACGIEILKILVKKEFLFDFTRAKTAGAGS